MNKPLENQLFEAKKETKKIFNEFYTQSKFEIILIWFLSFLSLGCLFYLTFL